MKNVNLNKWTAKDLIETILTTDNLFLAKAMATELLTRVTKLEKVV